METHKFFRPVGSAGKPRDRDRRCVRCQDGGRLEMRDQILENRLFNGFALCCGLDDQIALAKIA